MSKGSTNETYLFVSLDQQNRFRQLNTSIRRLAIALRNAALNFNMFPLRRFGSKVDRTTAKHLGQSATRLFIFFFVVGLSILALYTVTQRRVLTKTFEKPTLDEYNQLIEHHKDALKCPCSSIASRYDQFVTIEPVFHEVSLYNSK